MAIDPQFITLDHVEDFAAIGGEAGARAAASRAARCGAIAPRIHYAEVRELKQIWRCGDASRVSRRWSWRAERAARRHFRAFVDGAGVVARRLRAVSRAARAARRARRGRLARAAAHRQPDALDARARGARATKSCSGSTCSGSPATSGERRATRAGDVALFGDLPFMVSGDSADVWARQDEFRMDARSACRRMPSATPARTGDFPSTAGTCSRSATSTGCAIARRRNAELFDGYRVDHLVGFYRTYFRPHDGGPAAVHARPAGAQQWRSASGCSSVFREPGIGDHRGGSRRRSRLRPRVARSAVDRRATRCSAGSGSGTSRVNRSGIRVDYPAVSVATSGTHDTEPMVDLVGGRAARRSGTPCSTFRRCGHCSRDEDRARRSTRQACRTRFTRRCSRRCSRPAPNLLILPIQDIFGWRDRINQPATVGDSNWTWRLPWPADRTARLKPEAIAASRSS